MVNKKTIGLAIVALIVIIALITVIIVWAVPAYTKSKPDAKTPKTDELKSTSGDGGDKKNGGDGSDDGNVDNGGSWVPTQTLAPPNEPSDAQTCDWEEDRCENGKLLQCSGGQIVELSTCQWGCDDDGTKCKPECDWEGNRCSGGKLTKCENNSIQYTVACGYPGKCDPDYPAYCMQADDGCTENVEAKCFVNENGNAYVIGCVDGRRDIKEVCKWGCNPNTIECYPECDWDGNRYDPNANTIMHCADEQITKRMECVHGYDAAKNMCEPDGYHLKWKAGDFWFMAEPFSLSGGRWGLKFRTTSDRSRATKFYKEDLANNWMWIWTIHEGKKYYVRSGANPANELLAYYFPTAENDPGDRPKLRPGNNSDIIYMPANTGSGVVYSHETKAILPAQSNLSGVPQHGYIHFKTGANDSMDSKWGIEFVGIYPE